MKIGWLDEAFRELKYGVRRRHGCYDVQYRKVTPRAHDLDTPLIVSITSYPPRYPLLHLTLMGLLKQTVAADRTILWIAEDEMGALPQEVRALTEIGLEIRTCDNLRSYKKILPILSEAPDATIVTADDDVYYQKDWLEGLQTARKNSGASVICKRGHFIHLNDEGLPQPYESWIPNYRIPTESGIIFPTGVLGVLYAPGCFDARVTDWETASKLCPNADDIWLYWMHRMTGACAFNFAGKSRVIEWERNPTESLLTDNRDGGNDRQINAMIQEFGFPEI